MTAPDSLASNEARRAYAVQPYLSLPAQQQVFQAMVDLTAHLFGMPISIMSLVEAEHVQYPGVVGLPAMPRQQARRDCICSAAVYTGTTTVFSDLQAQPCPWVSPAAQAQTDLHFYAGHPLRTAAGYAIGTLCVLDTHPRTFTSAERDVLQHLAQLAMRLLDLQLALTKAAAPADTWDGVMARLAFSTQRTDTLRALAQQPGAPAAGGAGGVFAPLRDGLAQQPGAPAAGPGLYQEQLLLVADIDYGVTQAFARLAAPQP